MFKRKTASAPSPAPVAPSVATAFEDEVFFTLRRQRNIAAVFGAGGMGIGLVAVIALAMVMPLKEMRPYVVMVDRTTGESEQVVATRPTSLSDQEAVREAELVRYVSDRETYDVSDNSQRIPQVNATSDGQAAESLRALWNSGNDQYPPNLYGSGMLITVSVRSISLLDDDTAQVRFTRTYERTGQTPTTRDFVATITFQFRPRTETSLQQVWANPLGFTVTNYRVDAETLNVRGN